MRDHRELDIWKKSVDLVTEIYSLTATFPKDELYGLTSQIRRSAVSVPSNIAEGASRQTNKEFIQFLYIALGSASELETQIVIACNLKYMPNADRFLALITTVRKLINGLIRHYRSKGTISGQA